MKSKTRNTKARRPAARAKSKKAAPKRKAAAHKPAPRKAAPKPIAKTKPSKAAAIAKDAERKRLLREQRALERDVDNEPEGTSMSDSPEYIPEAMEDSLAEELGEASVGSAVSGDQEAENIRDEDLDEERGGPFVTTSAEQELARGTDESNPEDAEVEGFPTANARGR